MRRVSSVSGDLDMIVEIEASTIDGMNRVRDLIAVDEYVDDITTYFVLRRDVDRDKRSGLIRSVDCDSHRSSAQADRSV